MEVFRNVWFSEPRSLRSISAAAVSTVSLRVLHTEPTALPHAAPLKIYDVLQYSPTV